MKFVVLALLVAAVTGAAPPSDAVRAAMTRAIVTSGIGDGCSPADLAAAAAGAGLQQIGTLDGDPVVMASVHGSCLCGNVNCPWLVVRVAAGKPAVLLTTFAWDVAVVPGSDPLPQLRERAHDSALVTVETLDAYRNGRYVSTAQYRVRGDTGERKPDNVDVAFAPGASSAHLSGTVSIDWGDAYTFAASGNQHLTIDGLGASSRVRLMLLGQADRDPLTILPGTPVPLHTPGRNGRFRLEVDTDSESAIPYDFTLSIR